nr:hypothetical protein [Gammaproteobacteria bacterium]
MKDSTAAVKPRWQQRLALVGLFVIFFAPILAAWWMNVQSDYWRPSATINEGALVVPTRPVFAAGLTHLDGSGYDTGFFENAWTLVLVDSSACRDTACERQLVQMRQVRLALGKDMDRVQRLYAALAMPEPARFAELQRVYPGLNIARANPQWLTPFKLDVTGSGEAGGIYLVDPEGRLMMHYGENAEAKGILKDLQRLLKISKIG